MHFSCVVVGVWGRKRVSLAQERNAMDNRIGETPTTRPSVADVSAINGAGSDHEAASSSSHYSLRLRHTMLGVEGYGSDSDSDSEAPQVSTTPAQKPVASKPAAKSGLSLPPPSASGSKPSGLSLPAPKKKAPKKITIGLPTLPGEPKDDDTNDRPPPAKKARLEAGAGASALLSMLPAPKNKNPIPQQPERVLGGGRGPGLVFHSKPAAARSATVEDAEEEEEAHEKNEVPLGGGIMEEVKDAKPAQSVPFLPPSLAKGRANVSTEEKHTISKAAAAAAKSSAPAVDFFSLGPSHTPYIP